MIPVPVPMNVAEIESSSLTVEICASTAVAVTYVPTPPLPPCELSPFVQGLIDGLNQGLPFQRTPELLSLADSVLAAPAAVPEDWAASLAADFSAFND